METALALAEKTRLFLKKLAAAFAIRHASSARFLKQTAPSAQKARSSQLGNASHAIPHVLRAMAPLFQIVFLALMTKEPFSLMGNA